MRAILVLVLVLVLVPQSPRTFRVRLETSKGPIVIEVHRDWAPRAADRFYELVTARYFDDTRFFRVVEGQWAQFGINGDPAVARRWRTRTFPDETGPSCIVEFRAHGLVS